jgi:hypothetical protein
VLTRKSKNVPTWHPSAEALMIRTSSYFPCEEDVAQRLNFLYLPTIGLI